MTDSTPCKPRLEMRSIPARSNWICYLFGGDGVTGISYRPIKGREPNFFVRWMMRLCFDCHWKLIPQEEGWGKITGRKSVFNPDDVATMRE